MKNNHDNSKSNQDHSELYEDCYTATIRRIEYVTEPLGFICVSFEVDYVHTSPMGNVEQTFKCFDRTIQFLGFCFEGNLEKLRTIYSAKKLDDLECLIGSKVDLEVGMCDRCLISFITDYGPQGSLVVDKTLNTSSYSVHPAGIDHILL